MSQEYTPVDWVDETPTQPGTLINKERLDQMQSAHHFADGFEEVDAIPTADPGVDYHKVVYCTADSTFYRWDGTQWTADIDDDTKRLLLEHEADHSNPHAVTKAQVGLGNVDNTSDADKPVSTATASAIGLVQGYLDAHEANHSNPHQVTKAQVGLGNADNTADLDKPISTAVQAALDQKANDNAVVHLTGTETITGAKTFSVAPVTTGNAYIIKNAGHKYLTFQDGAGTSISAIQLTTIGTINLIPGVASGGINAVTIQGQRAYAAANTGDVATIATLDQYTPMVRTSGAQTIGGIKTFTDSPVIKNLNIASSSTVPGSNTQTRIVFNANDGSRLMTLEDWCYTGGSTAVNLSNGATRNSLTPSPTISLGVTATGVGYIQALNQRAYNTANVSDLVTIGTLKASTDVVHTSGPETIEGTKTFYAAKFSEVVIKSARVGTDNLGGIGFFNAEGTRMSQLYADTIGSIYLNTLNGGSIQAKNQRAYDPAHTDDVATIGTLDAYTPMVRTSGNQTIAGTKKFTYNLEELTSINGGTSPASYVSNYGRFRVSGQDGLPIVGLGFEKATSNVTRLVLSINGNTDPDTNNQTSVQIHFILNENDGTLKMTTAHIDKNGTRTFGTEETLQSWTV